MGKLTEGLGGKRSPFADMVPGETRPHTFADGSSRTITRTRRPFIFDWVDAANQSIDHRLGLKWVVDRTGTPQLVSMKHAEHLNRQREKDA